ncbi:excalibur calcium-binding domain-containing protein [Pseudonocardia sp. ICBG1293]|uniref:excalibur calcium-binding domain-containing protein n=1 Tax=Pseudonocardia sp. ICBG1293 TaxID=2844382 RepID=UPI001CCA9EFC|nr:excalibur calcium-binding domain-containing protein [Pseudonocardia sp. ICBG1293]
MTATQSWSAVEPATQPIPVVRRGNAPATAGFWLGIVGLLAGWVPFLGLLVTVPAWALAQAGRRRFRTGAATTAGRSGAGLALGVAGSVLCLLTTTIGVVGAANAPQPALPAAAPAAPAAAPAPAPVTVPDVVGMTDVRAREVLAQAGFTHVVLGPPSAAAAGVAAGTVTAQDPVGSTTHDRAAPVTLVEAAAAAAPVDTDVDRPYVPAPARPLVATPPAPRTAVAAPRPAPQAPRPAAPAPRPAAPVAPAPPAPAPAPGGGSAYYANCTAARNAGAAPLYRGDPGYRSALDRDNDGIACE